MSNKKASRACKDLDKSKAKAADINFVAACFDLKEVLLTSHRLESVLYYERELNTFNFTVYNMRVKDEHYYVWNETISMAWCIFNFLLEFFFYHDIHCGHTTPAIWVLSLNPVLR